MRVPIVCTPAIMLIAAIFAGPVGADDAASLEMAAVAALKESQNDSNAIVLAARGFAKAAQAYAASGSEEKAVEMNSYLYWCKKKMTMQQIEAFTKSGDAAIAESIEAVDKKVDASKAQEWFDRCDTFARAHPDEHLLIAIRFFETADRFKGTDVSFKAQDRSLKEQTLAVAAAPAKTTSSKTSTSKNTTTRPENTGAATTAADTAAAAEQPKPVEVPDAAKQKDIAKQLRDLFKDEYAKTKSDDKLALAGRMLSMAADPGNEPVLRFVELREARDLAAESGDLAISMKAVDKLGKYFLVDTTVERMAAFKKLLEGQRDKALYPRLAEEIFNAFDEALLADRYASLKALGSMGDTAAMRAAIPALSTRMKEKIVQLDEIQREWTAANAALEKLKADPKLPAANATAGKFIAFMKGDLERGLPMLALGDNLPLKKLAESDLANPDTPSAQAAVGDSWWDLAEKEKTKQGKLAMQIRCRYWYGKAQAGMTGLLKVRLDTRLAQLDAIPGVGPRTLIRMAGKWEVHWEGRPDYGKKGMEMLADGTIKPNAKESFGEYVPAKWLIRGNYVVIQFKNGVETRMDVMDDAKIKQAGAAEPAVYQRKD